MEITAAMVMALRNKTGLSMMECKKALVESSGDEAKAIEYLRKRGLAKAGEMATRDASQGRVACWVAPDGSQGGIVELRCETAPVANTDDFIALTNMIAQAAGHAANPTPESIVHEKSPKNPGKTIADEIADVFNRLREKIVVARVGKLSGNVGYYVHHNGQVAVLVEMTAPCSPEVKADVCMHITAMRPPYARRTEVDPALVEKEKQIATEQIRAQGKPENIIPKIVEGKINTWFGDIVLLEQLFVKSEGKQTVQQYLDSASKGLSVSKFLRFEVGAK